MPTARPRIPAARDVHDRKLAGRHDKKYGKPTRATQKYERFRHAGRMSEPRRRQTYQAIKQRPRSYRAVQYPRRAPPRQRNAHYTDAWNDRALRICAAKTGRQQIKLGRIRAARRRLHVLDGC